MYIYIYMCVCIYIYVYVYMSICMYIYMYIYIYTHDYRLFLAICDFPMFSKPHHNPGTSFGFDSATCADLFPWKGR